jgi:uncharacterized protein (DUF2147 family)
MRRLAASLIAALAVPLAAFADSKDVDGRWLVQDGNAVVEIRDCGDGTPCGYLDWVDMSEASSDRDINNPDPELNGRPLIGMPMLWGFREKGKSWGRGRIYDPEEGKTYGSNLKRLDDGNLRVKGCIGPLCKTQIWTPAPTGNEPGRSG